MRIIKWLGLLAAVALIASCFFPWVIIESRNITVSGMETAGTNYGKPGYFHFVMAGLFIICSLVQRIGAKRFNLLVTGLNLGWALRNFFVIGSCQMGDCPARQPALFMMLGSSIFMLIASFFPDMEIPREKNISGRG